MRKSYGLWRKREALRGVSIKVERGECYGLAGPNGAGKTTLIRLLLGLSLPDSGEVRLFGQRPDDARVRARVGFVPEAAELPPSASPRQLMHRFARLRGVLPAEAAGLAQLDRLGMGELLDRPAHKLSKGEKQRTLLALALLGAPELLVLDEPTDGLDPLGRALVRRVLREEIAQGRTVFLNSHLLSETERICTRVGILHRGELVREQLVQTAASGKTAVVLSDPPPAGFESAQSLQGVATESEGSTVVIDHDDVASLNAALDRLRAAGAQIVEVRRVRQDLEAAFAAAVTSPALGRIEPGPPPPQATSPQHSLARPFVATFRVAQEIASDLAARKTGWVALVIGLIVIGLFYAVFRHDFITGAAAAVRSMGGPQGVTDEAGVAHWLGRWAATFTYWALLPGSIVFAALFAPPQLDPRRTILLYAQPISRGDFAAALFASVCAIVVAEYAFLVVLLYGGIRWLGLAVSARFLFVLLPLAVAFGALYAISLVLTYLTRSGPIAGGVAFLVFVLSAALGARQHAAAALLPRVTGLADQAARLGGGDGPHAAPFVLTLSFAAGLFLLVLVAAQRSER